MNPMQNRMGVTCAKMLALTIVVLAARAIAGEHPLSGEFLHLRSRVTPGIAGIRLGAIGDALPEGGVTADPRVTGAVLEVLGDGVLGADAPAVPLPRETWRALGDPPRGAGDSATSTRRGGSGCAESRCASGLACHSASAAADPDGHIKRRGCSVT